MNKWLTGVVASLIAALGIGVGTQLGGAPLGIPSAVATSSARSITLNASQLLFPTSTPSCLSRVISTQQDAIKLTFSDIQGLVPSNTVGHVQAASTTSIYDASLYGCDAVRVFSYGTQTLGLAEFR